MNIRLVGHSGQLYMKVDNDGPWKEFINFLEENGHSVISPDSNDKFDVLIANSHSNSAIKDAKKNKIPKEKMILILWEPLVSDYKLHSEKVLENYGSIFSPSHDWGKNIITKSFKWPVLELQNKFETLTNWAERENKAVLISANKFSATKGELYSLRRRIAFLTNNEESLDIFGPNWNSGKLHDYFKYLHRLITTPLKLINLKSIVFLGKNYQYYCGISQNKTLTYNNYRISLVLENSIEYISEKLFDAAAGGGIIIYVGANISKYDIPIDAVIQVEPDANKIHLKITELQNLSIDKQYGIMKNQQKMILSVAKSWYCMDVLKSIAADICKEIDIK